MSISDLSFYQGDIDFTQAKKDLELAILRVQYGSKVEDSKHKEYEQKCKDNNIPFGSYAYARFVTISDAKQEATDFLSRIDKEAKFLVVDVEEQTCYNPSDLIPATQMFIDTCRAAGYKIGLYTGEYFYNHFGLSKVNADFLWIAKYSVTPPSIAYDLWQYTDIGRVAGIDGYVDLSKTGNKTLDWFIGTTSKPTPTPQPTPSQPTQQTYVVKSGDNLTNIAAKYHVSVDSIVQANNLKNGGNLIYVGQKLVIPSGSTPAPQYYVVKSGDTVSEIAVKYGTTIVQIKSWNGLDSHYTIYPNQKLRVK